MAGITKSQAFTAKVGQTDIGAARQKHPLHSYSAFYGLDLPHYESEANARYMGDHRNQQIIDACRAKSRPESMDLGAALRKSNVGFSYRSSGPATSEQRYRFQDHSKSLPSLGERENLKLKLEDQKKSLQKSHIDHAYGQRKSCQSWASEQVCSQGGNADQKFACERPKGLDELGKELRRSNLPIFGVKSEKSAPSPTEIMSTYRTEQKQEYYTKPIPERDHIGQQAMMKDLRASHIDITNGRANASTAHWKGENHKAMEHHGSAKWACEKPTAFAHLGKQLRQSNMYLGTDAGPLGD